jgi:hypothetical protein
MVNAHYLKLIGSGFNSTEKKFYKWKRYSEFRFWEHLHLQVVIIYADRILYGKINQITFAKIISTKMCQNE